MTIKQAIKRFYRYMVYGPPRIDVNISYIEPNAVLKGKRIIITGAGQGLGYAIAKKCIAEGADVLITGRNADKLKETSAALGDRCKYEVFDVQNIHQVSEFIKTAKRIFNSNNADCLINNAGISLHEGTFQNVTVNDFDRQFDTNLKGAYFLTKAFSEQLLDAGRCGSILMITSERGLYGDDLPYGLTKAALNNYVRGLARRLIKNGIRVNAVAPGVTVSSMTGYKESDDLYRAEACGERVFLPEEVAEVVCFLLSDASKCIAGEIIACDQGNYLRSEW